MQRDMSFDLDAAFSTRNEGELLSVRPAKTQVLRTPGLTVVSDGEAYDLPSEGADPMGMPSDSPLPYFRDEPASVEGLGGAVVNVPVLGQTNLLHVALGAAIGAAVVWFLFRKK